MQLHASTRRRARGGIPMRPMGRSPHSGRRLQCVLSSCTASVCCVPMHERHARMSMLSILVRTVVHLFCSVSYCSCHREQYRVQCDAPLRVSCIPRHMVAASVCPRGAHVHEFTAGTLANSCATHGQNPCRFMVIPRFLRGNAPGSTTLFVAQAQGKCTVHFRHARAWLVP